MKKIGLLLFIATTPLLAIPQKRVCSEGNEESKLKKYAKYSATFVGSLMIARLIEQSGHYVSSQLTGLPASLNTNFTEAVRGKIFKFTVPAKKDKITASVMHFVAGPTTAGLLYYACKKAIPNNKAIHHATLSSCIFSAACDGYQLIDYFKDIKNLKS